MTSKPKSLALELFLLACLALLWGSSYLWIKVALESIPPITLIAIRVSVAAALLVAVVFAMRLDWSCDARTGRMLFVQAFLNSTGAWTILAWGQQYVDSGLAGVLNSTSPIFVLLFTMLWTRHEATSLSKVLGCLLGIVGVIMIIGFDALSNLGRQVLAQLAVLTGAIMYAGAAIYGKQRFNHLHPTVTAAGTMIIATLCLVPLSLALERPWTLTPSTNAVAAAIILGVLCTGLALLLYFRLLRTLGSMGVASQAYLRAGLSVVLGVVILGEQLTTVLALGVLATIVGVALINSPSRAKSQM